MQQFQYMIEERVPDNGQRLLHLINQCKGQARDAIIDCFRKDPDHDYETAKEILRDNFGRDHMVTSAIIGDLFKGLRRSHDDADALNGLAIRMRSCQLALQENRREAELNTVANLERIVCTLPEDCRRSWAKRAAKKADADEEVTFTDLCEFVKNQSRIRRGAFGKFMEAPRSTDRRDQAPVNVKRSDFRPTRAGPEGRHFAMRGNIGSNGCPVCSGEHELVGCDVYLRLPLPQRWRTVRRNGLCFICLGTHHRSEVCTSEKTCGYKGCDKPHHRTLHCETTPNHTDVQTNICGATNGPTGGCLGVIPVRIQGPKRSLIVYALLDTGSDITLIEEDVTRQLGLLGSTTQLSMPSVHGSSSNDPRSSQ